VAGRGRPHLWIENLSGAPSASTERRLGEPPILWAQNAAAAIASHTLMLSIETEQSDIAAVSVLWAANRGCDGVAVSVGLVGAKSIGGEEADVAVLWLMRWIECCL
jgi:hypothetical protein